MTPKTARVEFEKRRDELAIDCPATPNNLAMINGFKAGYTAGFSDKLIQDLVEAAKDFIVQYDDQTRVMPAEIDTLIAAIQNYESAIKGVKENES